MILLNGTIVNEGIIKKGHILIINGTINRIIYDTIPENLVHSYPSLDISGLFVFPGIIDDQVHFREPGLEHKGDIYSESKAAAAGGITSYLEMPNTKPPAVTNEELFNKYHIASIKSLSNYGFYLGATNDNISEIKSVDVKRVPGIKIFMGSSTGDMLVDNKESLEAIFKYCPTIITTHCEDELTIKNNLLTYTTKFGENIPVQYHPLIRSREACYKSSSYAVELANKYGSKLHILHLSTKEEVELFIKDKVENKNITAEVCVHHLWFDDRYYGEKGNLIKWNPAIKSKADKDALLQGIINNAIDIIATDHAPHTLEEKTNVYTKSPSGGPLVQHSLLAMLDFYHQGKISLEKIIEKMTHNTAKLFQIDKRGFIKEGYWADLVIVDINKPNKVTKESLLYKCKWSPFEGHTFKSTILYTIINGNIVYENGTIHENHKGQPLYFNR